ncbi:MAG: hypothetical protein HRT47_06900 [Candidatus Caenarcaniphilales bacterium]|nr:hypothetical protein [Candidatus Caenarcaniphilales bacterium]
MQNIISSFGTNFEKVVGLGNLSQSNSSILNIVAQQLDIPNVDGTIKAETVLKAMTDEPVILPVLVGNNTEPKHAALVKKEDLERILLPDTRAGRAGLALKKFFQKDPSVELNVVNIESGQVPADGKVTAQKINLKQQHAFYRDLAKADPFISAARGFNVSSLVTAMADTTQPTKNEAGVSSGISAVKMALINMKQEEARPEAQSWVTTTKPSYEEQFKNLVTEDMLSGIGSSREEFEDLIAIDGVDGFRETLIDDASISGANTALAQMEAETPGLTAELVKDMGLENTEQLINIVILKSMNDPTDSYFSKVSDAVDFAEDFVADVLPDAKFDALKTEFGEDTLSVYKHITRFGLEEHGRSEMNRITERVWEIDAGSFVPVKLILDNVENDYPGTLAKLQTQKGVGTQEELTNFYSAQVQAQADPTQATEIDLLMLAAGSAKNIAERLNDSNFAVLKAEFGNNAQEIFDYIISGDVEARNNEIGSRIDELGQQVHKEMQDVSVTIAAIESRDKARFNTIMNELGLSSSKEVAAFITMPSEPGQESNLQKAKRALGVPDTPPATQKQTYEQQVIKLIGPALLQEMEISRDDLNSFLADTGGFSAIEDGIQESETINKNIAQIAQALDKVPGLVDKLVTAEGFDSQDQLLTLLAVAAMPEAEENESSDKVNAREQVEILLTAASMSSYVAENVVTQDAYAHIGDQVGKTPKEIFDYIFDKNVNDPKTQILTLTSVIGGVTETETSSPASVSSDDPPPPPKRDFVMEATRFVMDLVGKHSDVMNDVLTELGVSSDGLSDFLSEEPADGEESNMDKAIASLAKFKPEAVVVESSTAEATLPPPPKPEELTPPKVPPTPTTVVTPDPGNTDNKTTLKPPPSVKGNDVTKNPDSTEAKTPASDGRRRRKRTRTTIKPDNNT